MATVDHGERPTEALVAGSVRRRPCVERMGQWLVLAMRQMDVIVVVPKDERPTGVEARVGLTGVLRVNGSSLYDSAQRSVLPFRGLLPSSRSPGRPRKPSTAAMRSHTSRDQARRGDVGERRVGAGAGTDTEPAEPLGLR
ncbi:hypothetical protein ACWGA9_09545 [Streptomyces sp. NPDC054950]